MIATVRSKCCAAPAIPVRQLPRDQQRRWTMTRSFSPNFLVVAIAMLACVCPVDAATVNFDNLPAGHQSGSVYDAEGVKFSTCQSPDAISLNSIIKLTNCKDGFQILANADAVSPPNFAVADGLGTMDVLMTFTVPVSLVALYSDINKSESPDTIRLIALQPTGNPDEYKVINYFQALDNKIGINGDNQL